MVITSTLAMWVLLPSLALAATVVPIAKIEMTLNSAENSDPITFPAEVMAKTDEFLRLSLEKTFDNFDRTSLSIISEGITAVSSGGFVDKLDLSGSAFFDTEESEEAGGTIPSAYELAKVIDDAFRTDTEVFMEILSDSSDPFLSAIQIVDVDVDTTSVPDTDGGGDSGLSTGAVVGIAVGSAIGSALLLCVLCICCLGDPDEEEDGLTAVKPTGSSGSGSNPSGKTSSKSSDDGEMDPYPSMEGLSTIELGPKDELEVRSITSQDSSKFTYNPRSDLTFLNNDTTNINTLPLNETDIWKKGGVISDSVNNENSIEVPFGQDISAIVDGKDQSIVLEGGDTRSMITTGSLFINATDVLSPHDRSQLTMGGGSVAGMSMAAMSEVGIGIVEDDLEIKLPKSRTQSLPPQPQNHKYKKPTVVDDDLNDLGQLVAASRKTKSNISPYTSNAGNVDGDEY